MSTISDEKLVHEIIGRNGWYPGDPQVVKIVEYNNMFDGRPAWGLIYQGEDPWRYHNSPACHNPRTIWEARNSNVRS